MAKYVIQYPKENGKTVTVTKYVTDEIYNPHRTRGKSKVLGGVLKFYIREGKLVARTPGVMRRSKRVRMVNAALKLVRGTANHPAVVCAGLPWREFTKCLRTQMEKVISVNYTKEEEQRVSSVAEWLRNAYGSTPIQETSKEELLKLVD